MPTRETFAPFIGNIPVGATATLVAASTAEVSGLQTLLELFSTESFSANRTRQAVGISFCQTQSTANWWLQLFIGTEQCPYIGGKAEDQQ